MEFLKSIGGLVMGALGLGGNAVSAGPDLNAQGLPRALDFTVQTIDRKPKNLADYKGKVLLIVNVASRCGFTNQYEGLEALHKKYQSRGLAILAFPSNDFLGQEPGTEEEIKSFCQTKYNVTFDLFAKIRVKAGKDQHPLYQYLTSKAGTVKWNFHKYLVGKDGAIQAFPSSTKPEELSKPIEALL